ncbi:MAG: hypothetical protein NTY38_28955, partial [Acidobacteria bacterium]|nr:hypothetical protein [Acidobacteriota bacterium]
MKSLYVVAFALAMLPVAEGAIAPFCTASSAPAVLRAEGLTERTGDILIQCGGAAAGTPIITNLTVFLSASITNRLSAENMVDATLAADTGSGSTIILSRAFLNSSYSLSFNGLTVTPGASGNFSLRISGIRAAASNIPANSPILAYLATSGATQLAMTSNTVTVGIPQPSLLTSQGSSLVNCYGSPVPS